MPTPPISRAEAERTIAAINDALAKGHAPPGAVARAGQAGALSIAADALGLSRSSMPARLRAIKSAHPDLTYNAPPPPAAIAAILPAAAPAPLAAAPETPADKVRAALRRPQGADMAALRTLTGLGENAVCGLIEDLKGEGFNVRDAGGVYAIEKSPPLPVGPAALALADMPTLVSRPDNTFLIGACGDNHLGSKYSRLDTLNDLYDRYARAGVQAVYNTGNWIDGEARFNKHDLLVHGMEAQCRYLAEHYPSRPGITTYAVAGDDHEGWYGQREGVDIGRFAERIMREEGRADWVNLGYMESYIRLVNCHTGKHSIMAVVHPGGGSAYALSYSIQKIIEVLDGGEKPAVGLYGHYHKLWAGNIRNVWVAQTGTTEDQTPFMRKKKIDAHVGGLIIGMEQDPETGAIIGFTPQMIRYFNQGYYANRWSHGGDVTLPARTP